MNNLHVSYTKWKIPVWQPLSNQVMVMSAHHLGWVDGLGKQILPLRQHTSGGAGDTGRPGRPPTPPKPHFLLLLHSDRNPATKGFFVNTHLCTVAKPCAGKSPSLLLFHYSLFFFTYNYSTSVSDAACFEWTRIEQWCDVSSLIDFGA